MENINKIIHFEFLGNEVLQFIILGILLLLGILFKRFFSKISSRLLYRLFKRYSSDISVEKFVDLMRKPTALLILLGLIYVGFSQLNYPASWNLLPRHEFGLKMFIEKTFLIIVISAVIWAFLRVIDVFSCIMINRSSKNDSKAENQIIPFMFEVFKIVFIIIGVFVILGTVFNLNISSLIAGLGIGGLAVALAAKETIENLLGSFTIFLDKPFSTGDLVNVGDITGTIEKIGFRSTRIRTLDQSFVTVPNKKMIDAELSNLTQRQIQRVRFLLKLRMDTPAATLKTSCSEITKILESHSGVTENYTVKLYEFSDFSYDLLVVYFVNTPDYNEMLTIREDVNFAILEMLTKNNVFMAYPSKTIFMESAK